jgi:hypothetical protein
MVLYEIYRKDGGNGITFVDEGFLYFINEGFLYFVNMMILTSHKPRDITFINNL